MALTTDQYRTMRDLFRGALSVDSANPSDTDVLAFFKQLLADASGAIALSNARQFLAGEIARRILSGNFSNPTDANVVDFWTALASDANAGAAMGQTAQYQKMKKALVGEFQCEFFNPVEADIFGYFNFFGLSSSNFALNFPGTVLFGIQGDFGVTSAGGLITQANDLSGNAHHAVAAGAARPAVGAAGGRASIVTDGVATFLQAAGVSLPSLPYCAYAVFAPTASGSQANYFGGESGVGVVFSAGPLVSTIMYNGTSGLSAASMTTALTRVYAEFTGSVGDKLKVGSGATQTGASAGSATGSVNMCIGAGTSAPSLMSRMNLVLLVYQLGVLSVPQLATVDAQANAYWGSVVT